jgi:hypothetical protein
MIQLFDFHRLTGHVPSGLRLKSISGSSTKKSSRKLNHRGIFFISGSLLANPLGVGYLVVVLYGVASQLPRMLRKLLHSMIYASRLLADM